MYQQGRLTHFASFSPKSYLAAAAESESAKQELHTTLQHLQHQAHHTDLWFHTTPYFKLDIFKSIQ